MVKVMSGSSIIDLLVYRETVLLGRRIYLDFRNNPSMLESLPFDTLSDEAHAYLENAGACFGNPLERLLHMNAPAYDLYLSKGVDLKTEMLEIALCAQHNNGGLDDTFRFLLDDGKLDAMVQNVSFDGASASASWRAVRPLPEGGGFFENVWREYRENKNIY